MRYVYPLAVLVVLFLAASIRYNAVVPLGEGPDESGHAAYAFFLAEQGRLPVIRLSERETDVPGEGHQPPLAYALAAPMALWLEPEDRALSLMGNPDFMWSGGTDVNVISHGSHELWPWQGSTLAWHLMRFVSALLGALTICCTFAAARTLAIRLNLGRGPEQQLFWQAAMPLLAAGLLVVNPQFVFVSSLVTNDALLTSISALCLWLLLHESLNRIVLKQTTWRNWPGWLPIALGAIVGAGLLTKLSAMLLLPIVGLVMLSWHIETIKQWRWSRAWSVQAQALYRDILLMPLTLLLVAGWWFWRNWQLYGDPLGLKAFTSEFVTQSFVLSDPQAWLEAIGQLHASLWMRFGWMNVFPPIQAFIPVVILELLALAGLIWAFVSFGLLRHWRVWWPVVGLLLMSLAWIFSFALTAGLVAWQGRLMFPGLPALAIILASGLVWLAVALREQPWVRRGVLAGQGALCGAALAIVFWLPDTTIAPVYPQYAAHQQTALAAIQAPIDAEFRRRGENGIVLRGWQPLLSAKQGSQHELSFVWNTLGIQAVDWLVAVQVVDTAGQVWYEELHPPVHAEHPTSHWTANDWMIDRFGFSFPDYIPPGEYWLRVLLYDPANNNQHAGLYNAKGKVIGEWVDLGPVTLEP
jgi:4-amino-4-deoxy-L-arabinose transferase-like glycosyltransferase